MLPDSVKVAQEALNLVMLVRSQLWHPILKGGVMVARRTLTPLMLVRLQPFQPYAGEAQLAEQRSCKA